MRDAVRDTARLSAVTSRRAVISLVIVLVAVILVLVLHQSSPGPALTTSCSTPAIALSASSTGTGRGIDYSITGPKSGTYVVAIDATAVTVAGDSVHVSPAAAFAVAVHRGLPSCAAHGTLPGLAAGPHQVELFRDGKVAAQAALH